jgi:hypothetical protein
MDIKAVTDEIMEAVTSGSVLTYAGQCDIREQISNILFRENQNARFPVKDETITLD